MAPYLAHLASCSTPPALPSRLESHYFREQEAEFNASLHEYYAARARHQAEQQRLNQVSRAAGDDTWWAARSTPLCTIKVEQQRLTHVGRAACHGAAASQTFSAGVLLQLAQRLRTPCSPLPAAPPSILPQVLYGPYVHGPPHLQQCAVPPNPQQQQQQDAPMGMDCGWQAAASPRAPLAAVNGWQPGGGILWEGAAAGASRKRGHDAAMGEHASSGPGERGGVGKRMPWSMHANWPPGAQRCKGWPRFHMLAAAFYRL